MGWIRGGRVALIVATFVGCAIAAHSSAVIDAPLTDSEARLDELDLREGAKLNHTTVVPEPGAMMLVGTGLLLAGRRLRKTS